MIQDECTKPDRKTRLKNSGWCWEGLQMRKGHNLESFDVDHTGDIDIVVVEVVDTGHGTQTEEKRRAEEEN